MNRTFSFHYKIVYIEILLKVFFNFSQSFLKKYLHPICTMQFSFTFWQYIDDGMVQAAFLH